jgi:hypothetical protein
VWTATQSAESAEPIAVGSHVVAFSLEDQHGEKHEVDESVRLILFTRDMDGGDLIKEALADTDRGFLDRHDAVYIADISKMPALIARLFALPSMRKRPYRMLLDREASVTAALPAEKGRATAIVIDELRIQSIDYLGSAEEVRQAIHSTSATDPAADAEHSEE